MQVEINTIRNNPLLDRAEAEVSVNHEDEATPSKEDVKDRVAAENNFDSEEIVVKGVYTGFGTQHSKAVLKLTGDIDLEQYEDKLEEGIPEDQEDTTAEIEEAEETDKYQEIVSGTISDAKDQLNDMENPDYEAALEAEKAGKNRTTLVDWLEAQQ
jgi:small subunit ribosomal protein S24e